MKGDRTDAAHAQRDCVRGFIIGRPVESRHCNLDTESGTEVLVERMTTALDSKWRGRGCKNFHLEQCLNQTSENKLDTNVCLRLPEHPQQSQALQSTSSSGC